MVRVMYIIIKYIMVMYIMYIMVMCIMVMYIKMILQSVLRSLSTLMFIDIVSFSSMECESMLQTLSNSFSNNYIDLNSFEVVSSSEMRKNEAESFDCFASIIEVDGFETLNLLHVSSCGRWPHG